jgi:hypothetical protein
VYVGLQGRNRNPGGFTCIDLKTGEILGCARHGLGYSPVAADGRVFTTDVTMAMAAPRFSKNLYDPRYGKTNPFSHATYTTSAIADGRLYFRGLRSIYCFEMKKSAVLAMRMAARQAAAGRWAAPPGESAPAPGEEETPPWLRVARQPDAAEGGAGAKGETLPSDAAGLVRELAAPYLTRREAAGEALGRLDAGARQAALPELLKMLASDDWPAQTAAAAVVRKFGADARPAAAQLQKLFVTQMQAKRGAEAELVLVTLLQLDPAAAKGLPPEIAKALAGADTAAALQACSLLATPGLDVSACEQALAQAVQSGEPQLAAAAAGLLAKLGPSAASSVPALARNLASADADVLLRTLKALNAAGTAAEAALPELVANLPKLMDGDDTSRLFLRQALKTLDAKAVSALTACVKKREPRPLVLAAIRALADFGAQAREVVPILEEMTRDKRAPDRQLILEALKAMKSD